MKKKIVVSYFHREDILQNKNIRNEYQILGLVDRKTDVGTIVDGYRIFSHWEVRELFINERVDYLILPASIKIRILSSMISNFETYGIGKEKILIMLQSGEICSLEEYHYLPYLEFHVCDHCNLNCKGCSHFSPLVDGEVWADFEEIKRDFYQLKKLVNHIENIHILGGEPLLNKDLYRYIELVHEVYPYAEIQIVTNGLLIKKMDEKLISTIKKNRVSIFISLYPPMYSKIDEIVRWLDDNGIEAGFSEPVEKFSYLFDENTVHTDGIQRINCTCINLYHGKLAACPMMVYIDYFNKSFNIKFKNEDGLIDIYDVDLNFEKLKKRLQIPVTLCKKCLCVSQNEDGIMKNWSQGKEQTISDYVYMKEENNYE